VKNFNNHTNQRILVVFISLIVFLLIKQIAFFDLLEKKVTDLKFKTRALGEQRKSTVDTNIVFVAIDQKSLDFFDSEGIGWPWPRSFYAKVLNYLSEAKAVVLDIDFSNRVNLQETDIDYDEKLFVNSLKNSHSPFLIAIAKKERQNSNTFVDVILPPQELRDNAQLGLVNLFPDKDGVIRTYHPKLKVKDVEYSYIACAIFSKVINKKAVVGRKANRIINWYGVGGPTGTYKYYSFVSVLLSSIKIEEAKMPIISSGIFKNKIVFVGATAPSLLDYKNTPISGLSPFPAMEIHAVVLNNLIKQDFLTKPPALMAFIIVSLLLLIIFLLTNKMKNIWGVLISLSVLLIYFAISFYSIYWNFLLESFYPTVASLFSVIGLVAFDYAVEGRERRKIKRLFSKYVSEDVINDLLDKQSSFEELKGKEIYGTAFFSDIKDFTKISEKTNPKELINYLNEYFEILVPILLNNKSMLDKFMGDGIMAIFGAPIYEEKHALYACNAALEIQQKLHNTKSQNSVISKFTTRIGLNSGNMIVGNVGTTKRMDYTAIGDNVNIASRLESLNKLYGTNILVSENTYKLVENNFNFRELDLIAVKGKEQPLKVYELLEKDIEDKKIRLIRKFEQAVYLYRDRQWEKAIQLFNEYLKEYPDNKASLLYIERCEQNKKLNLPKSWNGVFYATTK